MAVYVLGDIAVKDPARFEAYREKVAPLLAKFGARYLVRGGAVEVLSLDFDSAEESYGLEPSSELGPEAIYERRWALGLLARAVTDLQNQYAEAGNPELFDALKGVLGGEGDVLPYSEMSQRLGQSEGALRTAASRLRSRWRKRLRELVAETVHHESEVQDELRSLIASVNPDV